MNTVRCQTCQNTKETKKPVPWICGECGHKEAERIIAQFTAPFSRAWAEAAGTNE